MRLLLLKPGLYRYEAAVDFVKDFNIGHGDLILTTRHIFKPYFSKLGLTAEVVYPEDYGQTDPCTEQMLDAIRFDHADSHRRIIGIGDGNLTDLAKLLALKISGPAKQLFSSSSRPKRDKELVLVPTVCGAGSEVTNTATLALGGNGEIATFVSDEIYPDSAVMLSQLLEGMPYKVFVAGSIDALIQAAESLVSPGATDYSQLFAVRALEIILKGYREIARHGEIARVPLLGDFLLASNYAGIAFAQVGAGAVQALARPLHRAGKVPLREASYMLFPLVFEQYRRLGKGGALGELVHLLSGVLDCAPGSVFTDLGVLLERILPSKRLGYYGITAADLEVFTAEAVSQYAHFLANSNPLLDSPRIRTIYEQAL